MADTKKQFSKAEAQRRFENALRGSRLAPSKSYEQAKTGKERRVSRKKKRAK